MLKQILAALLRIETKLDALLARPVYVSIAPPAIVTSPSYPATPWSDPTYPIVTCETKNNFQVGDAQVMC